MGRGVGANGVGMMQSTFLHAGVAAVLVACGAAQAQQQADSVAKRQEANRRMLQPIRHARPVRPPVIDLEAMAKERRPGQVLPGDAYVSGALPLGARHDEAIGLPNTAAPQMPRVTKAAAPKTGAQRADVPTLAMSAAAPVGALAAESVPAPVAGRDSGVSAGSPGTPAAPMQASHAIVHEPDPAASSRPAQQAPGSSAAVEPAPIAHAPFAHEPVTHEPAAPAQIIHESVDHAEPAAAAGSPAPVEPAAQAVPAPVPVAEVVMNGPTASEIADRGVEALVIAHMPSAQRTAPAKISVASVGGGAGAAQWRMMDQPWRAPVAGELLEGKIEVRAGIDAEVTVVIDDQVRLTVSRLGRVVIERTVEPDGSVIPSIALARGAVEVRPAPGASGTLARVRTPDQAFGLRTAAADGRDIGIRVEYDAFTGTRTRLAQP